VNRREWLASGVACLGFRPVPQSKGRDVYFKIGVEPNKAAERVLRQARHRFRTFDDECKERVATAFEQARVGG